MEFHDFLDRIDAAVPKEQEVHIVLDNYATHKTALVRNWLAKRPRYHHFNLTHGSWINQVERWFAQLSQKQIKRGNHHSVKQLKRRHRSLWIITPRPNHSGGSSPPTRSSPLSPDLLDP